MPLLPFTGSLTDTYVDRDAFQGILHQRGPSFFLAQNEDPFSYHQSPERPLAPQVMKGCAVGQAQSDSESLSTAQPVLTQAP